MFYLWPDRTVYLARATLVYGFQHFISLIQQYCLYSTVYRSVTVTVCSLEYINMSLRIPILSFIPIFIVSETWLFNEKWETWLFIYMHDHNSIQVSDHLPTGDFFFLTSQCVSQSFLYRWSCLKGWRWRHLFVVPGCLNSVACGQNLYEADNLIIIYFIILFADSYHCKLNTC